MSSSTDSLKKKVCVTVFLDELFEEVNEEEREGPKQVNEVTKSEVKLAEKAYLESSQFELDNHGKVNISPNADIKQSQVQYRPRKHRKESKFSKNYYDEYEKSSDLKAHIESHDCPQSTDSDFNLDDEYHELRKSVAGESRSSLSGYSELELTQDSFLSIDPIFSSMMICKKNGSKPMTKLNSDVRFNKVSYCNRSTQFNGVKRKVKEKATEKTSEKAENSIIVHEDQKKVDDGLEWKKTQKQIQLILAKAKSGYEEKKIYDGNQIRHYDPRSNLEEYEKTEEKSIFKDPFVLFNGTHLNTSTDLIESNPVELSDSYMCVFPHIRRLPEVKKIWTSCKKIVWNDGVEYGLSETNYIGSPPEINLRSYQNDSLLCYFLCVRCRETISEKPVQEVVTSVDETRSDSTVGNSSFESLKSKTSQETDLVFKTLTNLDEDYIGSIFKKDSKGELKTKNESVETGPELEISGESEVKSKNYAEGDTFEEISRNNSKLIFNQESKEKLFACDEILKHMGEAKAMPTEIIVNRAEIILLTQEKEKTSAAPSCTMQETNKILSEVFVKKKTDKENADRNMTDAESEMIFAESEAYCDSDGIQRSKSSVVPTASYTIQPIRSKDNICVVEFEDKLSRSRMLRRMKTVEIVGDNSMTDMKNISTEVILICENISNSDVCMEAWQSSVSTLKSINEVGQCYLKDSKDSSMYLIEIPLHFTRKKQKTSDSDLFFKVSDSD